MGATRLLRATLVAGAAAWAAGGTPAVSAPPRVEPGVFLYAAPSLRDPNFAESVVLLLDHGPDGSLGLIVNRPTRPGQVTREMRLGSWIVAPADARSIFSSEPSALWPKVHELIRRIEVRAISAPTARHLGRAARAASP